ncbi:MAG TPA: hypothetical protein DIT75_04485 [Rikenellaceae bacterium]|nr:hypothetical protein [Rikenellaceae bacterium]
MPFRIGLLSVIACLPYACVQEDLVGDGMSSDVLRFTVAAGEPGVRQTRSQSDPDDTSAFLQPLVLNAEGSDMQLYLHTYVRDIEDSEEHTATRSTPVNDPQTFVSVNKKGGFKVSAFYTDNKKEYIPAYSTVMPIDEKGSVWTTDPLYYWPPAKLRFFAFAPASASQNGENYPLDSLVVDDSLARFRFTVPRVSNPKDTSTYNDAVSQPDLMFATACCDKAGSDKGKVAMNFKHALSAIKFAVRDMMDGKITSIIIKSVAGSGKCVYDFRDSSFKWTTENSSASYFQNFNYNVKSITSTTLSDGKDDVELNEKCPEKTFMLIPQEIPEDAMIHVRFVGKDDNPILFRGNIRSTGVTKWEPGKEYVYTISTTSSVWKYEFIVTGSYQNENESNPSSEPFRDNTTDSYIYANPTVTKGAYFKVLSYKYRINDPTTKIPVGWTAEVSDDAYNNLPKDIEDTSKKYENHKYWKDLADVDKSVWLPDSTSWKGGGTAHDESPEVRYLTFCPQMTATDWDGDWVMRLKDTVGTPDHPKDLSMVNGVMSTANCYVVNAPGYYKLPLVYGNAITKGKDNERSYKFENENIVGVATALKTFQDYNGKSITSPKISDAKSAILVWQDAYNLISDVKLDKSGTDGYDYLTFKVNRDAIQQGNAVLGIKDSDDINGKIMWSWHIWVNEDWDSATGTFGNKDVEFDTWNEGYGTFTSAPHNLGWCDPKNLYYVKRVGDIRFTQKESKNEKDLTVIQRGKRIEYWIGNNVYYQFGRKDPIVGFMNSGSVVKYNFGELAYKIEDQLKNIQDGIKNPNVLYLGDNLEYGEAQNQHWLNTNYYNLWNNTSIDFTSAHLVNYEYSGIKTVYDPSPDGYMVPPDGFFKIMVNGQTINKSKYDMNNLFNGEYKGMSGRDGYYIYYVYTRKNKQGNKMALTGTGERWYKNYRVNGVGAGGNFNPETVYLWSNQIIYANTTRSGAGLALGGNDKASNYKFIGAAAMARPVRPVRERKEITK